MRKLLAALLLAAAPAAAQTVDLCAVTNAASAELTDEVLVCRPGTPNASRLVSIEEILDLVPAGIGGSVGSTDNSVILASGTGGATIKSAGADFIFAAGATNLVAIKGTSSQTTPVFSVDLRGDGSQVVGFERTAPAGSCLRLQQSFGHTPVYLVSSASGSAHFSTSCSTTPNVVLTLGTLSLGNWQGNSGASGGVVFGSGNTIKWSSAASGTTTGDVGLSRGAAGVLKVDDGSAGNGKLRVGGCLYNGSSASAPATCGFCDMYADTSGALCFCSTTNTWSMVFPVTPTTENCT